MVLAVSDDGIGMNSARGTGRGLASMTARAAAIGGSLRVSSLQGVCITLDILFPNTAKPM
jgi:signal transduction histidine kinase